jgi:hypothetical protein
VAAWGLVRARLIVMRAMGRGCVMGLMCDEGMDWARGGAPTPHGGGCYPPLMRWSVSYSASHDRGLAICTGQRGGAYGLALP